MCDRKRAIEVDYLCYQIGTEDVEMKRSKESNDVEKRRRDRNAEETATTTEKSKKNLGITRRLQQKY